MPMCIYEKVPISLSHFLLEPRDRCVARHIKKVITVLTAYLLCILCRWCDGYDDIDGGEWDVSVNSIHTHTRTYAAPLCFVKNLLCALPLL